MTLKCAKGGFLEMGGRGCRGVFFVRGGDGAAHGTYRTPCPVPKSWNRLGGSHCVPQTVPFLLLCQRQGVLCPISTHTALAKGARKLRPLPASPASSQRLMEVTLLAFKKISTSKEARQEF